jgi:hypothetical protein
MSLVRYCRSLLLSSEPVLDFVQTLGPLEARTCSACASNSSLSFQKYARVLAAGQLQISVWCALIMLRRSFLAVRDLGKDSSVICGRSFRAQGGSRRGEVECWSIHG